MKLIVNLETGEVSNANDCVMIDTDYHLTQSEIESLDGNDFFEDAIILEVAKQRGSRIPEHDLTWGNTIAFSPMALREEAEALIDAGYYQHDDGSLHLKAMEWVIEVATDADLEPIAGYILSDDRAWAFYKEAVMDGIFDRYMEMITESRT